MKSDKMLCIIYAEIESLIRKADARKFFKTKTGEHIPDGYMSKIWAFDHIEKKHILYRGRDCKKVCSFFREHASKVINFEKKNLTFNKRRTKIT